MVKKFKTVYRFSILEDFVLCLICINGKIFFTFYYNRKSDRKEVRQYIMPTFQKIN